MSALTFDPPPMAPAATPAPPAPPAAAPLPSAYPAGPPHPAAPGTGSDPSFARQPSDVPGAPGAAPSVPGVPGAPTVPPTLATAAPGSAVPGTAVPGMAPAGPAPAGTVPVWKRRRWLLPVAITAGVAALLAVVLAVVPGLRPGFIGGNDPLYTAPADACALLTPEDLDGWAGSATGLRTVSQGGTRCDYQLPAAAPGANQLTLTIRLGEDAENAYAILRAEAQQLPEANFRDIDGLGEGAFSTVRATGRTATAQASLFENNAVLTAHFAGTSAKDWQAAELGDHLGNALGTALTHLLREGAPTPSGTATPAATGTAAATSTDPCSHLSADELSGWLGAVTSTAPESPVPAPALGCVWTTAGLGGSKIGGPTLTYEYVVGDEAATWYKRMSRPRSDTGSALSGLGDKAQYGFADGYRDDVIDLTVDVQDGNRAFELHLVTDEPDLSRTEAKKQLVALATALLTRIPDTPTNPTATGPEPGTEPGTGSDSATPGTPPESTTTG
jgi:hypothetical protein